VSERPTLGAFCLWVLLLMRACTFRNRFFTVVFGLSCPAVFFAPMRAEAAEYEILKQNDCRLLLSPSKGLAVGETLQLETASGKSVSIKVSKKSKNNAIVTMTGQGSRCGKVKGPLKLGGGGMGDSPEPKVTATPRKAEKFSFGLTANGGLYTFKQSFTPDGQVAADGTGGETQSQTIDGLSGFGFSGGPIIRFMPFRMGLGFELGLSGLYATVDGKAKLLNEAEYVAWAKFVEVVAQPAVVFPKCLTSRLYCRIGGIVGLPISSTIGIKTTEMSQETALKYLRYGGDLSLGVNLGTVFTLLAGAQLTLVSGSFTFPETETIKLNPLTAYIFGGIAAAF